MSKGRPSKRKRSSFGQRLAQLRAAAGFTQGEIAEMLGISQSTYSDWEGGWVAIHPDRLKCFADIVGTTVGELISDTETFQLSGAQRGRLSRTFEDVSKLPLRQQNKILDIIDAFIAKLTVDPSS